MIPGGNARSVAKNWADDIDDLNHETTELHLRAVFWTRLRKRPAAATTGDIDTMARASVARTFNVLFLCTGNSARSIIAEALLNSMGGGRFRAHSAGSHPKGEVHPLARELVQKNRLGVEGLRSKSWDEFARPGAPELDFVFTVCDNAAGEACPVWPGQPMTAHWGVPDPALVDGDIERRRRAFFNTHTHLLNRLSIFVSLPLDKLDRLSLQKKLDEIGRIGHEQTTA
jgi:protein-tyrosine-phosphatase